MNIEQNGYSITDDKLKFDKKYYVKSLKNTYWAKNRSDDIIERSLNNSVLISIFHDDKQIGFTRSLVMKKIKI